MTAPKPVRMRVIARIYTDFPEKFGVPRQSGVVSSLPGRVVFEPEFRNADALRGLSGFSHLWLLWLFSENPEKPWSPTVRPPKLGGNRRVGVFASRSPFRPNPLGLTSVKLEKIEWQTSRGPVLHVRGADMTDGTPILDIKPYVPYTDAHPEALSGYAVPPEQKRLSVHCPEELMARLPAEKRQTLLSMLEGDPRPGYREDDGARIYGMAYAGFTVRFYVDGESLTVVSVEKLDGGGL